MIMYNTELKNRIHIMFQELAVKAKEIIASSQTSQLATERISEVVASSVSAESEGYIVDMYTYLVAKIKEEEFFKNPEHLNAFYRLNLREELNDIYHFDIKSFDSYENYKNRSGFKEVEKLYAAAGAAAGTLTLGGILKFALSAHIHLPLAIIIVGAVITGVAACFLVSKTNKENFNRAVKTFLEDMEKELLEWLREIEIYFDEQVRDLYRG